MCSTLSVWKMRETKIGRSAAQSTSIWKASTHRPVTTSLKGASWRQVTPLLPTTKWEPVSSRNTHAATVRVWVSLPRPAKGSFRVSKSMAPQGQVRQRVASKDMTRAVIRKNSQRQVRQIVLWPCRNSALNLRRTKSLTRRTPRFGTWLKVSRDPTLTQSQ